LPSRTAAFQSKTDASYAIIKITLPPTATIFVMELRRHLICGELISNFHDASVHTRARICSGAPSSTVRQTFEPSTPDIGATYNHSRSITRVSRYYCPTMPTTRGILSRPARGIQCRAEQPRPPIDGIASHRIEMSELDYLGSRVLGCQNYCMLDNIRFPRSRRRSSPRLQQPWCSQ
jgi:hypothetical protein